MSRRGLTITAEPACKRLVLRGWKGGELARNAGLWPLWIGTVNGWVLDLDRLPDLVAYLEYRGVRVRVTEASDAA